MTRFAILKGDIIPIYYIHTFTNWRVPEINAYKSTFFIFRSCTKFTCLFSYFSIKMTAPLPFYGSVLTVMLSNASYTSPQPLQLILHCAYIALNRRSPLILLSYVIQNTRRQSANTKPFLLSCWSCSVPPRLANPPLQNKEIITSPSL